VWAGAAFKSPDASSAVRIAAVSFDIMPRRRRCLLCGEHHEESSSCACPRCHEFHAGGDASCLSCAICGCWHAQDDCQNAFVAKCCKMCGDPHDPHRPCPCPYCHYWHAGVWKVPNVHAIRYVHALTLIIEWYYLMHAAGEDCRPYKDVSDGWSSAAVDRFIQSCCSLCGNCHDELRGCPCPRCLCYHPDLDCFPFDALMHRDAPCSRYGPCLSVVVAL
jgi:hypothetical protein